MTKEHESLSRSRSLALSLSHSRFRALSLGVFTPVCEVLGEVGDEGARVALEDRRRHQEQVLHRLHVSVIIEKRQ